MCARPTHRGHLIHVCWSRCRRTTPTTTRACYSGREGRTTLRTSPLLPGGTLTDSPSSASSQVGILTLLHRLTMPCLVTLLPHSSILPRRGLPHEEGSTGLIAVGLHPGGVRADRCTRAVAAPLGFQKDCEQLCGLHPSRHRSEEHDGGVCIPDQIELRPRVHEQEAVGHRRHRPSHAVRPSPQSQ